MAAEASQLPVYDAHCHLQDVRLAPFLPGVLKDLQTSGVRSLVVNGTSESDWARVHELATMDDRIIPSIGLHPWYVKERTQNWFSAFSDQASRASCVVGEIGLDHWIEGYDSLAQEQVFVQQLGLAAKLNRAVTIHCLRAWGRLLEILRSESLPGAGFLLHSYGGPAEMIDSFVKLGGYFSISGYFAHPRKAKQQAVLRRIPLDRIVIETDAPDMALPANLREFNLPGDLNHPGNITAVYRFVSNLMEVPLPELALKVEANFLRLFGPARSPHRLGS